MTRPNNASLKATPLLVGLLLTGLGLGAGAEAPPVAESFDQALALETFDAVWTRVNESSYDVTRSGLDWQAVAAEYRPQIAALDSRDALRRLLQKMLSEIGESHFAILPAEVMNRMPESGEGQAHFDTGLQADRVGEVVRITSVAPGSPGDSAGIRPGWVLLGINDLELATALAAVDGLDSEAARRHAETLMLAGLKARLSERPNQSPLTLRLQAEETLDLSLEPVAARGEWLTPPMLPPSRFDLETQRLPLAQGCAGLVRFNIWLPAVADRLAAAMPELKDCRGLVLDLRGNPGGIMAVMMIVGGHFLTEPTTLGTLSTPDASIHFRALPRRVANDGSLVEPYAGPLAILVDGLSMSTSEMFASGMQAVGRARVFGQQSPGMALPAQITRLPNGDSLMFAFAEYENPAGARIEGIGVRPDQPLVLTPEGLASGEDLTLAAALAWIHESAVSTP